jgi:hypothetical protein
MCDQPLPALRQPVAMPTRISDVKTHLSHTKLRSVGVFSTRYLLAGVAAEILVAATFVYAPRRFP